MDKIRFFFIALLGMGAAHLSAQTADSTQTSPWTTEGFAGLKLTQVSLTNWSAGGDNSVAFDLQGTYQANYKKGKHIWNNRLELAYGLNKTGEDGMRKANDKIYIYQLWVFYRQTLVCKCIYHFSDTILARIRLFSQ